MANDVIIDGVRYVPDVQIKKPDDDVILAALHELVSLHYFGQWHKAQGITGLVIEMLSPELSKVMRSDVGAAFERTSQDGGGDGN